MYICKIRVSFARKKLATLSYLRSLSHTHTRTLSLPLSPSLLLSFFLPLLRATNLTSNITHDVTADSPRVWCESPRFSRVSRVLPHSQTAVCFRITHDSRVTTRAADRGQSWIRASQCVSRGRGRESFERRSLPHYSASCDCRELSYVFRECIYAPFRVKPWQRTRRSASAISFSSTKSPSTRWWTISVSGKYLLRSYSSVVSGFLFSDSKMRRFLKSRWVARG